MSICYISKIKEEAVSTFLHLEELGKNKTALAIANGFKRVLEMYGVPLHNVVSI